MLKVIQKFRHSGLDPESRTYEVQIFRLKAKYWGLVFESVGDRDVADAAYKDVLKGGA